MLLVWNQNVQRDICIMMVSSCVKRDPYSSGRGVGAFVTSVTMEYGPLGPVSTMKYGPGCNITSPGPF